MTILDGPPGEQAEQAKRDALAEGHSRMADAHRIVAGIYGEPRLPLLDWRVSAYAEACAATLDPDELHAFYGWLDDPARDDLESETMEWHRVRGVKDGVHVEVSYYHSLAEQPPPELTS